MEVRPVRSADAQATRRIVAGLEELYGRPVQRRGRGDPLDMLIGTILSQNTSDINSHRAYRELRRRFPRWTLVAVAPLRAIASSIKVGGLSNVKSRRIKRLLREVRKHAGGMSLRWIEQLPDDEAISVLTSFNGVGVKTAACVLLFSLRRGIFPVDTHIHRILNRLGVVRTRTPEQTFEAMRRAVPAARAYSFHVNLIRFGRDVCAAQRPLCGICHVYEECRYSGKERFARPEQIRNRRRKTGFILLNEI